MATVAQFANLLFAIQLQFNVNMRSPFQNHISHAAGAGANAFEHRPFVDTGSFDEQQSSLRSLIDGLPVTLASIGLPDSDVLVGICGICQSALQHFFLSSS